MATRQVTRAITVKSESEESAQELPTQRKPPDAGRFRLQVDRQTKASYPTFEAAEEKGIEIKMGHPLVQVTVYDLVESLNKIIDLPKA